MSKPLSLSHDLNEALRIGDRIALMKDGQIMQIGTGEILTNPANEYVRNLVEDVDRSKVLTAQNIMVPALTTNIEIDTNCCFKTDASRRSEYVTCRG